MKNNVDNLGQAGSPVPPRALVSHVLLGLDEVYNPVIVVIQGNSNNDRGRDQGRGNKPTCQVCSNPFATLETVIDPNWYIDSGATNHVTAESSGLTNSVDYSGTDKVRAGNGNTLNITCVGHSYLTDGKRFLALKNILCVSDITKNLDKASEEILLKGTLKNDLYHLENAGLMVDAELDHSRSVKKQLMHKNKETSTFILLGGKNIVSINVAVFKAV
ncbi:Retrovirus-related Pol polyprotein from transposon TNT 1-94 [Cucumis melo var. makuwa]|uniref:Retrovirus-related Pol polyprotein from transposon TNT 1-94 n=1 Tax=Cucumis melo var. makuwa TaxID=1194695 RepID=A0A5A7U192_CUCMM|nr:Retrovirus-related Pol polyprotein from transposon TNT 1-94 [Cucumis melo var. makuwa]TYK15971.1 Retrovirus-related Pol polyprotein from transposon TNT 1-94 [Cucumis melo var. makuwa]